MAENINKPVKIVDTALRDAPQSLIATRMSTEEMLPIVEKMDKVGYYAVECWGGATFDACLRFMKEDPWERLRKFRDGLKKIGMDACYVNMCGAQDEIVFDGETFACSADEVLALSLIHIYNLQSLVSASKYESNSHNK